MPTAIKLALDKTGREVSNKITQEAHVTVNRRVRAVVPDYGAFFKKSLKVYDAATMQPLTSTQFEAIEMYEDLTLECGQEVSAAILITDESVSNNVLIDYQAVGGIHSYSAPEIRARYADVVNSDVPLDYYDIVGRPDKLPPKPHKHDSKDVYGLEGVRTMLNRIKDSVSVGDKRGHDDLMVMIGTVIDSSSGDSSVVIDELMGEHLGAINPHPQYVLKSDVSRLVAPIRRPVNTVPAPGASNVLPTVKLKGSVFASYYGLTHKAAQVQASKVADFSTLFFDVLLGPATEYQPATIFTPSTTFYWRIRYQDDENVWSDWSEVTTFSTSAISISQPVFTAPAYDADTQTEMPTFISGPFSVIGGSDTHQSSDWEIWTGPNGTGSLAHSVQASTTAKTSMTVPKQTLAQNTKYYARVRHRGALYGYSPWSNDLRVNSVWPLRPTVIGEAFQGGYWGGDIVLPDGTYAIIVAPKAQGQYSGLLTNDVTQRANYSMTDSVANTNALPREGAVAWVKNLTIGGFNDWVLPSANVMKKLWETMRSNLASAPTAFKSGGAEAFPADYHWTSTGYTNVYAYSGDPIPVYGYRTYITGASATLWQSEGGPPPAECDVGSVANVRYGYFFTINPSTGQPDTMCTTSWQCNDTRYEVIDYEPGETYTEYYYEGYVQHMGGSNFLTNFAKNNNSSTLRARAVRLVKVA